MVYGINVPCIRIGIHNGISFKLQFKFHIGSILEPSIACEGGLEPYKGSKSQLSAILYLLNAVLWRVSPLSLHLQIKNPKSTAGFGSRFASRPQQLTYPDELQQHLDSLRCASPSPCQTEAVYLCCESMSFCVHCSIV